MKDYSRKHYTDHQYKDWLKNVPGKSVFNAILEQHKGLGEFSNDRANRSSLQRAVSHFLKQSELKKPYIGKGFVQMEDDWEGPSGIRINPEGPQFDQPWNLQPGHQPWNVVFDLISTSTYCPGEEREFEIRGTEPIYLLELSFERAGTSIRITSGYGTNGVFGVITADDNQRGSVNFNGSMRSVESVVGSSNYLMPEGSDCCDPEDPLLPDPASTPETVARSSVATIFVLGGSGPFSWQILEGEGVCPDQPSAHWVLGSTPTTVRNISVTTNSDTRGGITVRCTDRCGTVVDQEIRCTSGAWVFQADHVCQRSGMWDEAIPGVGRAIYMTDGCVKQKAAYVYTNSWGGGTCGDCPAEMPSGSDPECIGYACLEVEIGDTVCAYKICSAVVVAPAPWCWKYRMLNSWDAWE